MNILLPNALTIAGSDSGGGAGIQADLKTFTTLGVYGTSVITALTAQSGLGVAGIHAPNAEFVALQLETVLKGFPIHAAKTGMLFNAEIIESIVSIIAKKDFPLVVDPVCVSTSGHTLIQDDAINVMKKILFPLADLITPNRPEAELLTGIKLTNEKSVQEAAMCLLDMGAKAVLIKGGHPLENSRNDSPDNSPTNSNNSNNSKDNSQFVTDWFVEKGAKPIPLSQAYINTVNSHGTGCTLSAAITAYLAKKESMKNAVIKAQEYLNCALRHSYAPGNGIGPVNHLSTLEHLKK